MAVPKKNEELRLLYQVFIEDIRYSKQQQWNTIYLTLVAIGGIWALLLGLLGLESKQILSQRLLITLPYVNCIDIPFRAFLGHICFFIAGLGIIFVIIYQIDIARYRSKKREIMRTFSRRAERITEEPLRITVWEIIVTFFFPFSFACVIAGAYLLVSGLIYGI